MKYKKQYVIKLIDLTYWNMFYNSIKQRYIPYDMKGRRKSGGHIKIQKMNSNTRNL